MSTESVELVGERVGIHLQHLAIHVVAVELLQRNIGFVDLVRQIFLEAVKLFGSVFVGKLLVVEKNVVSHIVGLENLVVGMYAVVYYGAHAAYGKELVEVLGNVVEFVVDARSERVVHLSFEAKQTCLHADEVVFGRLLEVRVFALEQKFASFQIVVGVILIADGYWGNVELLEALNE